MKCPICGKSKSSSERQFNNSSVRQHMSDAHKVSTAELSIYNSYAYQIAEDIAGDESDGAFWGIYLELQGF